MSIIEVHGRLGNTVLFYTLIMAGWSFWRYFRREGVSSSIWGATVIAEVMYLIQDLLGVFIWISGAGRLSGGMHILYGVVNILILPAIFLYTRGDESPRTMLIYGAAYLFLVGTIYRSIATAG